MIRFSLLIFLCISLVDCAHRHTFYDLSGSDAPNGLKAKVEFIKNKGDKMDVKMSLVNGHDYPIIIEQNAISMKFNGEKNQGAFRPNRRLYMRPGDWEEFTTVLRFSRKVHKFGNGHLLIDHAFREKSNGAKGKKLKVIKIPFELKDHRHDQ